MCLYSTHVLIYIFQFPCRAALARASHVPRAPITKNREDRNNPSRRIREPVKLIKARASELRGIETRGGEGRAGERFPADGRENFNFFSRLAFSPFSRKRREVHSSRKQRLERGRSRRCYFITPFVEKERDPAPSLTGPIANLAPTSPSKLL